MRPTGDRIRTAEGVADLDQLGDGQLACGEARRHTVLLVILAVLAETNHQLAPTGGEAVCPRPLAGADLDGRRGILEALPNE